MSCGVHQVTLLCCPDKTRQEVLGQAVAGKPPFLGNGFGEAWFALASTDPGGLRPLGSEINMITRTACASGGAAGCRSSTLWFFDGSEGCVDIIALVLSVVVTVAPGARHLARQDGSVPGNSAL